MSETYIVWKRKDGYIYASCRNVEPPRTMFGPPPETREQIIARVVEGYKLQGFEVFGTFTDWRLAKMLIQEKRLEVGHVDPSFVDPIICEGFVLCENPAKLMIPHVIIGKVPMCVRCATKLGHITEVMRYELALAKHGQVEKP